MAPLTNETNREASSCPDICSLPNPCRLPWQPRDSSTIKFKPSILSIYLLFFNSSSLLANFTSTMQQQNNESSNPIQSNRNHVNGHDYTAATSCFLEEEGDDGTDETDVMNSLLSCLTMTIITAACSFPVVVVVVVVEFETSTSPNIIAP
jgi:hypothetical protein